MAIEHHMALWKQIIRIREKTDLLDTYAARPPGDPEILAALLGQAITKLDEAIEHCDTERLEDQIDER